MRIGFAVLVAAYMLSQFYRTFLAVLSAPLGSEIGATPDDLATASGLWFLTFAAMQIPVGAALDRFGPRLTATLLLTIGGGGGAAVFAMAGTPAHVSIAMGLIGVGCSPVLMASYYIIARTQSAAVFATLAGAILGVGSLGNIAGAAPLSWAVAAFGWRETVWMCCGLTLIVALLIHVTVTDPPKVDTQETGSLVDILRLKPLWPLIAITLVAYAPAGGLRGLWVGPYAQDVYGAGEATLGLVTLIMGLAMIAGSLAYGPLDRMFGTRKWVILGGNAFVLAALVGLALAPSMGLWASTAMLAVVGFAGASYPMIMAHGRAFIPPHLLGRGVTLINLFSIGGVGLMQLVTGRVHRAAMEAGAAVPAAYGQIFTVFALSLGVGMLIYLVARDRTD